MEYGRVRPLRTNEKELPADKPDDPLIPVIVIPLSLIVQLLGFATEFYRGDASEQLPVSASTNSSRAIGN